MPAKGKFFDRQYAWQYSGVIPVVFVVVAPVRARAVVVSFAQPMYCHGLAVVEGETEDIVETVDDDVEDDGVLVEEDERLVVACREVELETDVELLDVWLFDDVKGMLELVRDVDVVEEGRIKEDVV